MKVLPKPDRLGSKGWGVRQPYITGSCYRSTTFWGPVSVEAAALLLSQSVPRMRLPWVAAPPPGSPAPRQTVAPSLPPPTLLLSTYRQTATKQNVSYVSTMTTANFQNKSLHEAEARISRIALYRSTEWLTSGALLTRFPPAVRAESLQILSSCPVWLCPVVKATRDFPLIVCQKWLEY